jgi:flagellar assembly protein FliH
MDSVLRAPHLIDQKRVLSHGGRALPHVDAAASSPSGSTRDGVQLDMVELKAKLSQAELKVEQLQRQLDEATQQLESLNKNIDEAYETARDDGFALGKKQGVERADAERKEKALELKATIESATQSRDRILKTNQDVLAEVVFAAVVRMLGRGSASIDAIRHIVAEATSDLGASSLLRLRVARRDVELVKALVVELFGDGHPCEVVADDSVALGGCILEQENGSLDARLETQLDALRRAVMKPVAEVSRD